MLENNTLNFHRSTEIRDKKNQNRTITRNKPNIFPLETWDNCPLQQKTSWDYINLFHILTIRSRNSGLSFQVYPYKKWGIPLRCAIPMLSPKWQDMFSFSPDQAEARMATLRRGSKLFSPCNPQNPYWTETKEGRCWTTPGTPHPRIINALLRVLALSQQDGLNWHRKLVRAWFCNRL